jgi:hypothetical protein
LQKTVLTCLKAVNEYVVEDNVVEVCALDVSRLQFFSHLVDVFLGFEEGHEVVVSDGEVLWVSVGSDYEGGKNGAAVVDPPFEK